MNARNGDKLKNLANMFDVLDVRRQVLDKMSHDMTKKAGDQFSGVTAGRNNMSAWVARLWILGRKYMTVVRGVIKQD